jgi:ABC-type amino acid transport substrate-binding protein
MKRVYFVLALLIVLILGFGGYVAFSGNGKLVVVGLEYNPHSYYEDMNVVGLHVDVAKRVFDSIGVDYVFQLNDWVDSLAMIRNDKADVLMTASYKKDRETFIAYTEDQLNYDGTFDEDDTVISIDPILFFSNISDEKKMSVQSYKEIRDNNYKVGILNGMAYFPKFFDEKLNFYSFVNAVDGFESLNNGFIDYFAYGVGGYDEIEKLGFHENLGPVDWVLFEDPIYLVFSKKTSERIVDDFYAELLEMKRNGELSDLYDKYNVSTW